MNFRRFVVPVSLILLIVLSLMIAYSVQAKTNLFQSDPARNLPDDRQPGTEQGSVSQATNRNYLPLITAVFTAGNPVNSPNWAMAAANPERTSWVSEEVRGDLKPLWYKPFEPYILYRTQIVTAHGNLYISTASGLYALDAKTGAEKWVYPTELPLGHSPTIYKDVAYVGGYDRKLHAIHALTGKGLWTFEAGAGFDTNPLVINGLVLAGNRDGSFYAVITEGPKTGQLAWKFQTGGPIHFSAAYKNGIVFFASDDSHAYALDATTGSLVWKSEKLLGSGFHSYWPVIYGDWVFFTGSNNYRFAMEPGGEHLHNLEMQDVYPNHKSDPVGTMVGPLGAEPGNWAAGTPTIDTSRPNQTPNGRTTPVTEYFENKPWRRTVFVLSRQTGKEYTSDFDRDGKPEYAPFLWFGNDGSGNRFPPVVGGDGVIYQSNNFLSDDSIAEGYVTGWKLGTPFISLISRDGSAIDETLYYSAGGSLIYINKVADRFAGAYDISIPEGQENREWGYFSYNLPELLPGYNVMTYVPAHRYSAALGGVYGGRNGIYGWNGEGNPLVPYQGAVYFHGSNAVIAFSPSAGEPTSLPLAKKVTAMPAANRSMGDAELKTLLAVEVQKILQAGHLRPGYINTGHFDRMAIANCGDDMGDYWHNPGDTLVTLIQALPYLSADKQAQVKAYLQEEFTAYPPYEVNHIGWKDGAAREVFILPPEIDSDRVNFPPKKGNSKFPGWDLSPTNFYAMWKYAQVVGGAKSIFDAAKDKLEPVPAESVLLEMPHVHNAYIAGYLGYLELEKLAGYSESTQVRSELNRLLALRVSKFTIDAPEVYFQDEGKHYCRALNASRNFIHLVPELGQYLHDNALAKVQEALAEYYRVAPLWFVSKAENAIGEDSIHHLYDVHGIFLAKAYILQEPRSELVKYLDVPAMAVGDLFYIQNLVAALQAGGVTTQSSCFQ